MQLPRVRRCTSRRFFFAASANVSCWLSELKGFFPVSFSCFFTFAPYLEVRSAGSRGSASLPVATASATQPKLRSLDPRPRRRPRPRSVGVFCGEESPIVPQLFCPVSLIVKHRHSRGRRTTTSTRTTPQFRTQVQIVEPGASSPKCSS